MELGGGARIEHFDTIIRGIAATDVRIPDVACSDTFVDLAVIPFAHLMSGGQ
jgi:hypothetical protein